MWKVTLKGLLTHRVRLVLTTISVVLGVSFVAGTYVLTDTMNQVFDDLVRRGSQTIDVLVRGATADTGGSALEEFDVSPPALPEELLDEILAVEGVGRAEGTVEGYAMIVRPDGQAITPMGPPALGAGWSSEGDRYVLDGGRPPTAPGEVVVDARTAERNGLQVGDRLGLVFASTPPQQFELVGLSSNAHGDNLAGATLAEFDLSTAQEVLDLTGTFTGFNVWGADGVDPDELVTRLASALPSDVEAITSADWADETMAAIEGSLGFITVAFGVFAAIALIVGAFIIANTFSVTVLQRSREFALLRALGATRRQIVSGVVGEAVVVAIVASIVGIVAGLGLAIGMQALLSTFGFDVPSGAPVLRARTVVVALAVGLVVTVVSSLLPARRAASVHPIAAMRDVSTERPSMSRRRRVIGTIVTVVAAGLVAYGAIAQPDGAGVLLGAGAVATLVALGFVGPWMVRGLLGELRGPSARLGMVGHLATGNSLRTPRRTWTTAAALTVGLALVSSVAVIAASMKASVADALDQTLQADVIVSSGNAMTGGSVPPVVAGELATLPEVGAISPLRAGSGRVADESGFVTAVDPTSWGQLHRTDVVDGALVDLAEPDTVLVDRETAALEGHAVGDVVPAQFATGATELRIAGVYEPDDVLAGWVVGLDTYERFFPKGMDAAVLVAGTADANAASVRAAVDAVVVDFPGLLVQDQAEYRDTVAGQIDQIVAMFTALLGMALFIAVLGIMNTLALSIHERTREIGLLRAVGMTRRQVRRLVRWEAVTVALLGAAVGLVLGTAFGWAATRVLEDEGLRMFVVPFGQILGALVLAVVAGVLAAILPARRAAKLDVLRAVTVE